MFQERKKSWHRSRSTTASRIGVKSCPQPNILHFVWRRWRAAIPPVILWMWEEEVYLSFIELPVSLFNAVMQLKINKNKLELDNFQIIIWQRTFRKVCCCQLRLLHQQLYWVIWHCCCFQIVQALWSDRWSPQLADTTWWWWWRRPQHRETLLSGAPGWSGESTWPAGAVGCSTLPLHSQSTRLCSGLTRCQLFTVTDSINYQATIAWNISLGVPFTTQSWRAFKSVQVHISISILQS